MNDNNDNFEGMLGKPLSFSSSDLRASRLIVEGVLRLNRTISAEGVEAGAALLKTLDPIIRMAVLARFTEAWNGMVANLKAVDGYFRLFGSPQHQAILDLLTTLDAPYRRIQRETEPEIEARVDMGFDQPWNPDTVPEKKEPSLTDEEEKRVSLILEQLRGSFNPHDKPID